MNTPNDPKGAAGATKTPLGLIPPFAMEQTAWAHKLGAEKYGPYNWRDTGVCASTYINAMMRHLNAWRDGEDFDPESGISHLAHVACNCNILLDADYCNTLQDDRNKVGFFVDEQREPELQDLVNDVLESFYADNDGYVGLEAGATLEEGDEYFDDYDSSWYQTELAKSKSNSNIFYRRPIRYTHGAKPHSA